MVFLTKDTPEFLFRALEYYDKHLGSHGINLVIADASKNSNWSIITKEISKRKYSIPIHLLHVSALSSLSTETHRLAAAIPLISTPYVLLASDDDFYYFDWLKPAVDLLDSDNSFGIVYGHTIKFELERYMPFGKMKRAFIDNNRTPPAKWLEGSTPLARLSELGSTNSNWATVGWYSLQRTEILKIIVDHAEQNDLNGFNFEKLLIFCQAALSKTRMIDEIYLARQINGESTRPPYSYKAEKDGLEKLMKTATAILSKHCNLDLNSATEIVEKVFLGEIRELKRADSKTYLRAVADHLPFLRHAREVIRNLIMQNQSGSPLLATDERFPIAPKIYSSHAKVLAINDAVAGRSY